MTKSNLNQHLTADTMFDIARDKFFARGEGYYAEGAVQDMVEVRGIIKATVVGTHDYRVKIWVQNDDLDYACNCPVGQNGLFCKHLVATGLTWLEQQQEKPPGKEKTAKLKKKNKKPDIFETLRGHLSTLDKKQLINIIIEQAEDDAAFRNTLSTKALAKLPISEQDLTEHKEFIRNAIQVHSFVDYRDMYRYLQKVEPVYKLVAQLYTQKHFEQVVELSAYALRLSFTAYNKVDDSNGGFGGILDSLSDYHYQACHDSQPNKKQLAKSLFDLQMKDGWSLIDFRNYEKLLGKQGLDQFKTLATKCWQKVENKNADERDSFGDDYNITQVMQQLAEIEGDIEAVVAIKKRNLSSGYKYLEIAEVYKKAKRYDEALQWAEQGLKAFKNAPHTQLVDFLITEYQRRKQHDKAIQLAWQEFIRQPSLQGYQQLKACANKANSWEHWRKKTLQWLRKEYLPKLNNKKQNPWQWVPKGHSLLVEIFLWEKNIDKALHEAKTGGCIEHLWFALARTCEKTYPAEALKIYQDRIGGIIELTNNDAYDRAAELLKIIKKLMQQLKLQSQFKEYVEQLRKDYKQKRNFIKKIGKI